MKSNSHNLKNLSLFALLMLSGTTTTFAMVPANPALQLKMRYTIVPRALNQAAIDEVENIIGYRFRSKNLLIQALTTRAKNRVENYEQLEFLGDKVLDAILAKLLLKEYPYATEGWLTAIRHSLVSQEPMAALCLQLGLYTFIQGTEVKYPISTLCDIIESIIGAMYEDGGAEAAQNFVFKCFIPMLKCELCPRMPSTIIKDAARNMRENIEYVWPNNDLCRIERRTPGIGTVINLSIGVTDKNNKRRLIRYLAEREFIKNQLPGQYQKALVILAIDPDYKQVDKAPSINLSWKEGLHTSTQERLHTLMQKLGLIPTTYNFEEREEGPSRFTCTLGHPLLQLVSKSASTKNVAAEMAADVGYKTLQISIIFSEEIALIPHAAYELDLNDPVNSLKVFCQTHQLALPTYTAEQNTKNGIYVTINAPWLNIEIKGRSKSTTELATADTARRVLFLLKHLAVNRIEPKKLNVITEYKRIEPTGFLIHLCRCFNVEEPKIETYYCESLVTEPLRLKTIITMTDDTMVKKIIVGNKALNKTDAQNNAAKKAAYRLINKMLRKELFRYP